MSLSIRLHLYWLLFTNLTSIKKKKKKQTTAVKMRMLINIYLNIYIFN